MNAHSIVELLQPCMHAYCYKHISWGWFKGRERATLFLLVVPLQAHSEPDTICTGEIGDCNTRMLAFRNELSKKMLEICTIILKCFSFLKSTL